MNEKLAKFFQLVANGEVEIYNEFSLQHELGIFLRSEHPELKVQFERNVSYFDLDKAQYEKKEIDLVMFPDKTNVEYVMELKFPRNGQVPETMFSFCKDIAFIEQLVQSGFKRGYFVAVVDDKAFYEGNPKGIYGLFRNKHSITGHIQKPTGAKDKSISISGQYEAHWLPINGAAKYCVIEVSS